VHYLGDDGRIALGSSVRGERATESDPVNVDVRKVHELVARWWPAADVGRRRVELRLNGTILWSREIAWLQGNFTPVVGKNVSAERGCAAEFSGTVHQVQRSADGRDPLLAAAGDTMRLRVRLPAKPAMGTRDALVVTGRTAAGDIVTIEYVDGQHVRFAHDHWGGGGGESALVRLDFARPHELEIQVGSLAAAEAGRPARHARRSRVQVRVDGAPGWEQSAPFYAGEPDEVAVGRNPIGGTSCGPWFTGDLLFAERVVRD
jgi:hypothetical protein